jgi:hypothetical protein
MAVHPIQTPSGGVSPNTGPLATAAWCLARGLFPNARDWYVEIVLFAGASRFEIEIYAAEWGFAFHHDERVSWIRVTDIPFVHGRDDFELLRQTSGLRAMGDVVRSVEHRFDLAFDREGAEIRTNIEHSEPAIRAWVNSL